MLAIPSVRPVGGFSIFAGPRYIGNNSTDDNHNTDNDIHADSHPNTPAARRALLQAQQVTAQQARTSALTRLKSDEEALRRRRENISRFGATWMKPAGVAKTLQAEDEELLERQEQEVLARREQQLLDMQAEQEALEARQRAEAANVDADVTGVEERDLDAEIPDADADAGMDSDMLDSDDEDQDADMDDETDVAHPDAVNPQMVNGGQRAGHASGEVTFNDDSLMLEGSMLAGASAGQIDDNHNVQRHQRQLQTRQSDWYSQLEEAELTGVAQEQLDLGMDVNLDLSVPEAGGYEHTDTELEDDSDDLDSDDDDAPVEPSSMDLPLAGAGSGSTSFAGRLRNQNEPRRVSAFGRSSIGSLGRASFLESSFVSSSPVLGNRQRAQASSRPVSRAQATSRPST